MQQMCNKADKNLGTTGFILRLASRLDRSPALLALFEMRFGLPPLVRRERTLDVICCDDMTGRHSAFPESKTVTSSSVNAALGIETRPFRVLITDLTVPMLIN